MKLSDNPRVHSPAANVDRAVLFALACIPAALCFGIAIVLAAVATVIFRKATLAFFAAEAYPTRVADVALSVLLPECRLRETEKKENAKECSKGREWQQHVIWLSHCRVR